MSEQLQSTQSSPWCQQVRPFRQCKSSGHWGQLSPLINRILILSPSLLQLVLPWSVQNSFHDFSHPKVKPALKPNRRHTNGMEKSFLLQLDENTWRKKKHLSCSWCFQEKGNTFVFHFWSHTVATMVISTLFMWQQKHKTSLLTAWAMLHEGNVTLLNCRGKNISEVKNVIFVLHCLSTDLKAGSSAQASHIIMLSWTGPGNKKCNFYSTLTKALITHKK